MSLTDVIGQITFRFTGNNAEHEARSFFEKIPPSLECKDLTQRVLQHTEIWFVRVNQDPDSFDSATLRHLSDLLAFHEPLSHEDD